MYRPRRQLVVHAEGLVLRFFNFYSSQLRQFERAAEARLRVRAFGEVRRGFFGAEMAHPRYRIVDEGEPLPQTLTPIYPTTAGLEPSRTARSRAGGAGGRTARKIRCPSRCGDALILPDFRASVSSSSTARNRVATSPARGGA